MKKIRCRHCGIRALRPDSYVIPSGWISECDIYGSLYSALCPECQRIDELTLMKVRQTYEQLEMEATK